jgi:hypothetical protein
MLWHILSQLVIVPLLETSVKVASTGCFVVLTGNRAPCQRPGVRPAEHEDGMHDMDS